MQPATIHPHAHRARPTTQQLAWLGLGSAATAFVVFEVAKHGAGPWWARQVSNL